MMIAVLPWFHSPFCCLLIILVLLFYKQNLSSPFITLTIRLTNIFIFHHHNWWCSRTRCSAKNKTEHVQSKCPLFPGLYFSPNLLICFTNTFAITFYYYIVRLSHVFLVNSRKYSLYLFNLYLLSFRRI